MSLTLQDIGLGTAANDGTGDTPRAAGTKINANNAAIIAYLKALANLDTVGTAQIDNSAVTLAKIANIATARILGNVSGISAAPAELTAAQVKSMLAISSSDISDISNYLTTAAAALAYQPLDADLTSWAAVTRASGFDTFAATPSSANLRSLLTDETGTGALYFAGGNAGTPSAIVLTNATGLPVGGITATGTPSSSTYLRGDWTWETVSASPGGSSGQVQYNNAGAFGGVTGLTLTAGVLSGVTVTGANMPFAIGNGGWGGTNFAVPYVRPSTSGGHIAFDVMPNGGPDDVWIDICSTDIVNDSSNYETLKLYKGYNSDAYIRTTKAGGGTKRSLQLGGATTKFTFGASDTVAWVIDASGNLIANTDATYAIGGSGVNRPQSITVSGDVVGQNHYASGYYAFGAGGLNGWMRMESNGALALYDAALTSFSRIMLGGTTSSFPALKRDGVGLRSRLADDSADTWIKVLRTTVSGLPSAATSGAGAFAIVTDASAPTIGSTISGGGSVQCFAISDGSNWKAA